MASLDALVEISGGATRSLRPVRADALPAGWGRIGDELQELLLKCNGFHAFESALHVYGLTVEGDAELSLAEWNEPACWRSAYGGMADEYLFFAEDVFGGQFAIGSGGEEVVTFDPETAQTEHLARSLEEWGAKILDDTDYLTGYSLGHAWQRRHGRLDRGSRLLPKIPFVTGGAYDVQNLHALNSVKGMRFRGEIAMQIANLPDGAQVTFRIE